MLSKNWRIRTLSTFFQGSVKAGIHSLETLSIHRRIEANSLVGHLLFIYSILFDLVFFYRSIHELYRVLREEVRVHPIVDSSGMKYGKLSELRERIDDLGSAIQILDFDHEFFRGANQTWGILVNLK